MSFPLDEMDDIINDFLTESSESLESLDQKFVELEKNPGDLPLLNEIFRSIHTIKGAAGFLGFQQMVDVTHVTEDVLNKLRKSEMRVTSGITDAILQSVDLIKILLNNIREKNGRQEDTAPLTGLLTDILSGKLAENEKEAPPAAVTATAIAEEEQKPRKIEENKPRKAEEHKAQKAEEGAAASRDQSIRVDIDRLDTVLNLAGELVLSRNRLMKLGSRLGGSGITSELETHLNEAIAQLDLVTSDLQLGVMKIRMQPVAKVFNKFPRMVRDLARQTAREVELAVSGEETELDKTVIEEIGDPLVHLIRNSVDHGMESPEERVANGKPRCGTIGLSAYQEGRNIIVSVSDDGKGMDPEAIKRSAVEKGLLSQDDAEKLSAKDAFNLIFLPGFQRLDRIGSQNADLASEGRSDKVEKHLPALGGNLLLSERLAKEAAGAVEFLSLDHRGRNATICGQESTPGTFQP